MSKWSQYCYRMNWYDMDDHLVDQKKDGSVFYELYYIHGGRQRSYQAFVALNAIFDILKDRQLKLSEAYFVTFGDDDHCGLYCLTAEQVKEFLAEHTDSCIFVTKYKYFRDQYALDEAMKDN